ncbi:response regulator [Candidatus Woesearchaeota archaeon]|nr:response regulator [Candidatus Woesearchaeota archaeon]
MDNILIVEDEPTAVELEKSLLEIEGIHVETVENGQKALDLIKAAKPRLIILDIMLPDISGIELYEKIRENEETKDIKIIFVTVLTKEEIDLNILDDENVIDYLTKPFDNKDFLKAVKKALQH